MKYVIYLLLLFLIFSINTFSQFSTPEGSLYYKKNSTSETGNTLILSSILLISPALILDDGNAYFGLSKELSAGKFPYGRLEFDYSYIFRSERTSAIHLSYNFDIPLNGNFKQPSLFMISPGAGYYTDLTRKGYFGQVSLGIFASTGFSDAIAIHPNIKFRKTFMNDSYPGVFELSIGVGFGFYSN
ncbi:MAG: hypothetical protein ABI543_03545 [Ignavibacteria bacterium]